MDVEKFTDALKIKREIDSLKEELESLKGCLWNKVKIELETGYYDMGRNITRNATFNDKVASDICEAINNIVKAHIAQLEKEFNEL